MPNLVKVRKWGDGLGIQLPKSFTSERGIVAGTMVEIDDLKVIDAKLRRRDRYKLNDLLRNYTKPPKRVDFAPVGKELA